MLLLNQANQAIWQKSWSTSIVFTAFPWNLEVNGSKEEKRACPFSFSTSKLLRRVGFEISRERHGLLLQSRKIAKRWRQSSYKTYWNYREIEFTTFLVSGATFLGREAVKRATKSREVPRHKKIVPRTVLKVYCSEREASRKPPGSSLLSIFPGNCQTFRKCIE